MNRPTSDFARSNQTTRHFATHEMTEHESYEYELALKLAEERKFKDLYLRLLDEHGCLITTRVRDERLLIACAGAVPLVDPACNAIDWTAIQIVQLLVRNGADKRRVFQTAARVGNLDLLQVAFNLKWYDVYTVLGRVCPHTSFAGAPWLDSRKATMAERPEMPHREVFVAMDEVLTAATEGSAAKRVFEWLVKFRSASTYFDEGCVHKQSAETLLFLTRDLLCKEECTDAADFLMAHATDLGFEEERMYDERLLRDVIRDLLTCHNMNEYGMQTDIVQLHSSVFSSVLTEPLDFLCSHFDQKFVLETVRRYVENDSESGRRTQDYIDSIRHWLQEKGIKGPRGHLTSAIATLDTVKENLPEQAYTQLVTSLQEAYKGM